MAQKPLGDFDLFIGPQPVRRGQATPLPKSRGQRRRGLTPDVARRVTQRAPEAVVRITGSTRGFKHMLAHLRYIHRRGKLEGETSDESLVIGGPEVKELAREWFARREAGAGGRQNDAKDTINCVFSMPEGTPRLPVTEATKIAAKRIFGERFDYVMVTHTDRPNPHVHLTVLARGRDGTRLNPGPEDLQAWRERFAEALRERGVEAEATPREVRGVVTKSTKQALFHIERRGKEKSHIRVDELREAVAIVTGQIAAGERPWEQATKKRQARVRGAWLHYADALDQVGDEQSRVDAKAVREMIAKMPEPLTRRESIEKRVRNELGKGGPESSIVQRDGGDHERE